MSVDGAMIAGVHIHRLAIPTIRPHALSMTTIQSQRIVLVQIQTQDGLSGWGEATTIGGLSYAGESPESICSALEHYLAPLILGRDARRPGLILDAIRSQITGNWFARCAVETALLDLVGQRNGLPVSELLGGRIRDQLSVLWVLASGDTDKDIAEARAMIAARRHNIFKLKIGRRPWRQDVAHVSAIKAALGSDISIRVDVNQAWNSADARRATAALGDAGIDLIEQPLPTHDRAGAARLRSMNCPAIMADEVLRGGLPSVRDVIGDQSGDVIALKIGQCGGLLGARDVAAYARVHGVGLYGGTMLESGLGTCASAHVFATLPELEWGTELFSPLLLTTELLENPLIYRDFGLIVPDGPGLGVRPSSDALVGLRETPAIYLSAKGN